MEGVSPGTIRMQESNKNISPESIASFACLGWYVQMQECFMGVLLVLHNLSLAVDAFLFNECMLDLRLFLDVNYETQNR